MGTLARLTSKFRHPRNHLGCNVPRLLSTSISETCEIRTFHGTRRFEGNRLIPVASHCRRYPMLSMAPTDRLIDVVDPDNPYLTTEPGRLLSRSALLLPFISHLHGKSIAGSFAEGNVGVLRGTGVLAFKKICFGELNDQTRTADYNEAGAYLKGLIRVEHGDWALHHLPPDYNNWLVKLDGKVVYDEEDLLYDGCLCPDTIRAYVQFETWRLARMEFPAIGKGLKAQKILREIYACYPKYLSLCGNNPFLKSWSSPKPRTIPPQTTLPGPTNPPAPSKSPHKTTLPGSTNLPAPSKGSYKTTPGSTSSTPPKGPPQTSPGSTKGPHKTAAGSVNPPAGSKGLSKKTPLGLTNTSTASQGSPNPSPGSKKRTKKQLLAGSLHSAAPAKATKKVSPGSKNPSQKHPPAGSLPSPVPAKAANKALKKAAKRARKKAAKKLTGPKTISMKGPLGRGLVDLIRHAIVHSVELHLMKLVSRMSPDAVKSLKKNPYGVPDVIKLIHYVFPNFVPVAIRAFKKNRAAKKFGLKKVWKIPSLYYS